MFVTSCSHLPNLNLTVHTHSGRPILETYRHNPVPHGKRPLFGGGASGHHGGSIHSILQTDAAVCGPQGGPRCPQLTSPMSHGPWLSHLIFGRCSYKAPVHPSAHPGQTTQALSHVGSGEGLRQAGPRTQSPHVGGAHGLHSSSISTSAMGMKCAQKHKEGTPAT